jgi:hypothetical protein
MKNILLLIASFGWSAYACATTMRPATPDSLIKSSDLIALVDVGEVHSVETPEKIIVQTAKAKLIDVAWSRNASTLYEDSKEIIIYTMGKESSILLDDNMSYAMLHSQILPSGKALVCLVRGDCGPNTFRMKSFHHLDHNGKILWPAGAYTETDSTKALQEIKDLVNCASKK